MITQSFEWWLAWMTDERLNRWNHYRDRAGETDFTRNQAASILADLSQRKQFNVIEEIKERIDCK